MSLLDPVWTSLLYLAAAVFFIFRRRLTLGRVP